MGKKNQYKQWALSFLYDLSVGGQFAVSVAYKPQSRCAALQMTDRYIIMCLLIGTVAFIYQVCP